MKENRTILAQHTRFWIKFEWLDKLKILQTVVKVAAARSHMYLLRPIKEKVIYYRDTNPWQEKAIQWVMASNPDAGKIFLSHEIFI